jgi:hypothetical protein
MRLDLRGVGIRLKPERFDERGAEGRPVDLRQRRDMRIEIADRAVHLAEMARRARCRTLLALQRAATLASSLPTVVGVAVWPWVRASMPTRRGAAPGRRAARRGSSIGSSRSRARRFSMSA